MAEYIFNDGSGKKPIKPEDINNRIKLNEQGIDLEGFPIIEEKNGGFELKRESLVVKHIDPFRAQFLFIGAYAKDRYTRPRKDKPFDVNDEISLFYLLGSDLELRMNLGQRSLCVRE